MLKSLLQPTSLKHFPLLALLPFCPTANLSPTDPHLLPSLSLFSSINPSFSETDNKTSFSMADLWFTPSSTPSQIADRGWVTVLDPLWCRTVMDPEPDFGSCTSFSPHGWPAVLSSMVMECHKDSKNVYNTHTVLSKEIPFDLIGVMDAILKGKRDCWNTGKRKSCFTDRDL